MDQADMEIIGGHLVGDPFRPGADAPNSLHVACAEVTKLLSRYRGHRLGVLDRTRFTDGGGEPAGLGELSGAKDLRMAGENLLDQSGARARQAEDEHRYRGGIAEPAFLFQQSGAEHPSDAIEALQRLRLVVDDLLPLERIALQEMAEGPRLVADVGQSSAEPKTQ